MVIRVLLLVGAAVASGCTTANLYGNLAPECPGPTTKATTRAASCMTAAGFWLALEEVEASRDASATSEVPPLQNRGPVLDTFYQGPAQTAEYAVAREQAMDSLAEDAAASDDDR